MIRTIKRRFNIIYNVGLKRFMTTMGQIHSLAVTVPTEWKRSLLLFEKVWFPMELGHQFYEQYGLPSEFGFGIPEIDHAAIRECHTVWRDKFLEGTSAEPLGMSVMRFTMDRLSTSSPFQESFGVSFKKRVSQKYSSKGIVAVPIYGAEEDFLSEFYPGKATAYQEVLHQFPIIAADALSWDQVRAFRADHEAVGHYRALRTFILEALVAKSASEIEDILGRRMDKYRWAIRKHGLQSLTGAVSSVLSAKSLLTIAATAGVTDVIAGLGWASLAAGTIAAGKISISIADRLIDLADLKQIQFAEVALIIDAHCRFS
jgi:hypothetical protein